MNDEVDDADCGVLRGHPKRALVAEDTAVLVVETDETDENEAHEGAGEIVWLRCKSKDAEFTLSSDGKTGWVPERTRLLMVDPKPIRNGIDWVETEAGVAGGDMTAGEAYCEETEDALE